MLQPGDLFGDYRVLKLLGKGGMGAVYLLENASGAVIAAKILDPAAADDREARKRFLREAQLALGVKHPNLVETYDVGEDPDTGLCYILMEYVPGGDLAGLISVRSCGEMSGSGPIAGHPMVCVVPESGANGAAWQTLADSDTGGGGSVIGGRRVGRGRLFYVYQQMIGHSEFGRLNAEWWRGFLPRCVDSKGMDAEMPDRRNAADMSDVGFNAGELEILAPARFEHQAKALTELMVGLDDIKQTTDFRGFLLVDSATHSGGSVDGYSLLGAHYKGFPAHSDEMRREILQRIRKMKGEGK